MKYNAKNRRILCIFLAATLLLVSFTACQKLADPTQPSQTDPTMLTNPSQSTAASETGSTASSTIPSTPPSTEISSSPDDTLPSLPATVPSSGLSTVPPAPNPTIPATTPVTTPATTPATKPTQPATQATQPTTQATQPQPVSKLNGEELFRFSIVYADEDTAYSKRAALYIQTEVEKRTGYVLPLMEDSLNSPYEHEIVVGETNRAISAKVNPVSGSGKFSILAEGKRVALEGEYFVIAAAAYYFVETYVPYNNYSATIPTKVSHYAPIVEKPKNYVMLIGDGMGLNATRLFDTMKNDAAHGDGEDLFYGNLLPYLGYSRTNSLDGITDSAAGGTALACGFKTHNRYVGQDKNHKTVQSLTELAGSLGMSTAILSTDAVYGTTPSTFTAHVDDRSLYDAITAGQAQLHAKYGTIIDCDYDTFNKWGVGIICDKVTNALTAMEKNPNGCFLMYEEAYVDMNSHNNDMENTFNAIIRFNRVIAAVMEYAYYHPNTFVLITADHETGGITLKNGKYVFTTTEHTGANVPVFVHGYGGEVFNGKTVENVQIAQTFASFWGVKNFGDQSVYKPLA